VLRGNGISTTTMGLGEGFDELLLSGMAEAGGGNFQYISAATELRKFFDDEIGGMTTIAALMPRLEIRLPEDVTGELLNQFPSRMVGRQLQIDLRDLAGGEIVNLVILLSQHSAIETGPVDVLARYRFTVPETGRRAQQEITLPRLVHGNAMDATAAPVTPAVQIARAMEESLRDQRQALAFDRAGRFEESRRAFGDSHARLAEADAVAASSGYASRICPVDGPCRGPGGATRRAHAQGAGRLPVARFPGASPGRSAGLSGPERATAITDSRGVLRDRMDRGIVPGISTSGHLS
jgi:Ca-activated chloride channel family protein